MDGIGRQDDLSNHMPTPNLRPDKTAGVIILEKIAASSMRLKL
jgi:hypothetical protein